MTLVEFIGYAAACVAAVIFLPQVIQTIKTKDTSGLSMPTFVLMVISNTLWATYGFMTMDYAIILSQVFLSPMALIILGYKLRFG